MFILHNISSGIISRRLTMREKERDKKDYQANNAAKKERKKENTTTTNNKFLRLLVNRIACLVILPRKSTDSETCNFSRCG